MIAQWASEGSPDMALADLCAIFTARMLSQAIKVWGKEYRDMAIEWLINWPQGGMGQFDIGKALFNEYYELIKPIREPLSKTGLILQARLKRSSAKKPGDLTSLASDLRDFQIEIKHHNMTNALAYYYQWLQARYQLYADDYQAAHEHYLLACENAIYNTGENNKIIFKEAMAVAAMQDKPKVKMRKIKARAAQFAPDILDENTADISITVSDDEIENWRMEYCILFHASGWFPESLDLHFKYYHDRKLDLADFPYRFS